MRQGRVGHELFAGEQGAHAETITPGHEALAEVQQHRAVVDLQLRMPVPAFHISPRGAAGHEDALAGLGRHAAQREVFEAVDGHGRDVMPVFHRARRTAPLLAELLEGRVVLELLRKQAQGQGVEVLVTRVGARDERQHVGDDACCGLRRWLYGLCHDDLSWCAAHVAPKGVTGAGGRSGSSSYVGMIRVKFTGSVSGSFPTISAVHPLDNTPEQR